MQNKAYSSALSFLARREYGAAELEVKLKLKGFSLEEIQEALADCQRLNLQSDVRFCKSLCQARIRQGYGPRRIRRELQEKRIADEIIEAVLATEQENWLACAQEVRRKKYKNIQPVDYEERQKQKQFLYYRGFALDTIEQLFNLNSAVES
jgi:regulatory protein